MVELSSQQIIPKVSTHLREWIHEVNNSLFVSRGFLEEIKNEVENKIYSKENFDHENFLDMIKTVARNVDEIEKNLQKLRKYAKQDVFEIFDIHLPPPQA